jgi:hypothetical protein
VTIGWDYILRYLQSGTVQIFSNEESYFDEPEFMAVQNPGALYNFCADDQNYFGVCSEFNAIYSEINHRYTPHLSQVKSIGNYRKDNWWDMPQILVQCENESPLMVNVFDSYFYSLGRTYASGLGLVGSQVIEIYYFNRFDIEGYVKDGDTIGIITPDDVLLDINAISPEQVILIFPNPAKEKIVIRLPEKSKVQIFDSKGQIKFAEVFAEPESEIDLRNFVPGVYFVKFVSGRKSYTQKLIVE